MMTTKPRSSKTNFNERARFPIFCSMGQCKTILQIVTVKVDKDFQVADRRTLKPQQKKRSEEDQIFKKRRPPNRAPLKQILISVLFFNFLSNEPANAKPFRKL